MKFIAVALCAASFLIATRSGAACATGSVTVAYAASLVHVMEGPLAARFQRDTGVRFSGEAKGSKALAHLIAAGLRTPDVFISADSALLDPLLRGKTPSITGYTIFASARMVVAYSDGSAHRRMFERAARGDISVLDALAAPGVRVGRTDPQLDPKGARTLRVLALLGRHDRQPQKARAVASNSEVFPEEDLAVRIESGELDAGFFYSTETPGRNLRTVELPADANLAHDIAYSIARLTHAPNPAQARSFVAFLLSGPGKGVLEAAGLRYLPHPKVVGTP